MVPVVTSIWLSKVASVPVARLDSLRPVEHRHRKRGALGLGAAEMRRQLLLRVVNIDADRIDLGDDDDARRVAEVK